MKRFLFLVLSVLIAFPFLSCGKDRIDIEQYAKNYIHINETVPLRVNVKTAVATPLCPDPLCSHDSDNCPFYQANSAWMPVMGQYIYFLSGYGYEKEHHYNYSTRLCRFDLISGKREVLFEPEDRTLTSLSAFGGYVYFNCVSFEEIREAAPDQAEGYSVSVKRSFHIYRYDPTKDAVECLSDEAYDNFHEAYAMRDDRIYWNSYSSALSDYSTDLDYKQLREESGEMVSGRMYNEYIYSLENLDFISYPGNFPLYIYRLNRTNTDTGETAVVLDRFGGWPILHEDNILFTKYNESLDIVGYVVNDETGERNPVYDSWGSRYYICNADGSGERLLCDVRDVGYLLPAYQLSVSNDIAKGDHIIIRGLRHIYEEGTDTILNQAYDYLLINIKTGEVRVIEIDERA